MGQGTSILPDWEGMTGFQATTREGKPWCQRVGMATKGKSHAWTGRTHRDSKKEPDMCANK